MVSRNLRNLDISLIVLVLTAICIGLVVISSATASPQQQATGLSALVKRQLLAALLGCGLMVVAITVDYNQFRRLNRFIYGGLVLLLGAVLILGYRTSGTLGWISFGSLSLQPAEPAKILLIVALADFLAKRADDMNDWKDYAIPFLYVIPPLLLILMQPDLGTALVFVAILLGMLLVAGAPLDKLVKTVGGGFLAVAAMVVGHLYFDLPIPLKRYQLMRLIVFINPDLEPLGAGYQLKQSMIAVGSGQLLGKGLYAGSQSQLKFLPAQHTDFIFAVIGEELGFVGAFLVMAILTAILIRGIRIARNARDLYGSLIATGVVSMLAFHTVVGIGMTLGLMPITGLPLPFISYGGSALITNCLGVGLLLNVHLRRQKIRF